jgi:hypothetical protein
MVSYFLIVQQCIWSVLKIVIIKKIKSNVSASKSTQLKLFYLSTGWSNVYGYNMSCLKNYVMREPLVDTVDKRQVCTDHYPLKVSSFLTEKSSFFFIQIRHSILKPCLSMILTSIRNFDFGLYGMITFMHL